MKTPRTPEELRAAVEYLDDAWARPKLPEPLEQWWNQVCRNIAEDRAGRFAELYQQEWPIDTPPTKRQLDVRASSHAPVYDGARLIHSWDGNYGYDEVMKGARASFQRMWPPEDPH